MLLRKTITALFEDLGGAFQHLALKSDTVNVHISALISSCKNFSHSVAALAMPLLSIFGPALTQVIDLLSKATAYMNQFLSALTGKSYYIASIKQNYDYAESLKEIEKAVKKLNTIGIDEFNIISPDDKDLDDLEDCYEQLEIAPDIAEWAQKIKDAFLEQDWEGIGKQIADLMNSGLGKLYDKLIDITPKVEQALKNFSTAFNSWVENFDWDLLGRTIGAGVNLLVKSFNALTGDDGIDFENLGSKLSVGFRGMINEIEWDELGNALGNGFMISWRIADGFIQDMWRIDPNTLLNGWQELGIAIGELETLATALNTIDFASIVKKINAGLEALYSGLKWENGMGEQITKFTEALSNAFNDLLDINFGMVGSIIGAGITDIVRAFNQLVENIDFERLGQNLADGIRSLFAEIEWDELGNALGNGFMVAWRILGGFIKEMSKEKNAGLNGWEELGTAIGEAISSLFEKIDWNTISLCISGLVNGISDLLFKSFSGIDWKDLGTKIGQFIKKTLEDIDFKDLGRTLGTVFQSAVDFLKSIVSQISLKDVTDAFIDLFKGFFEKANWEDVAPAILLGFGSFATDILPKSLSKYLTIAKVAALALAFIYIFADSFKEVDWSVVGEGISESINNFLSNIDGARLAKGATDLTNGLMEALSSCVRSIDWSQLWGIIIDFLTNINYLDGLMLPLKFFKISADLIAGLVIGLIEAIFETDWGEVWDNILATFKEFFGIHSPSTVMEEQGGFLIRGLINGIFSFIGSVGEAFRELVGEVKKALEEKWNEVVEWWNNTTLVKWWNDSVAPWFTKEKWSELYSSIKTGLEEKWSELQTWWEGTGFSQWIEGNIKPWFTKEKWLEIYDSVKTGLQGKWEELKAWWDNTSFSEWIDSNVKPWFTKEKWLEIYDNFKKSFTEKWEELKKWWKDTGFSDWIENNVKPWFTKERWSEIYDSVKTELSEKWDGLVTWWNASGAKKWIDDNVKPWFTKKKWLETYDSVKTGLQGKWEELKQWWQQTNFSEWIDNYVKPWFTKEKWSETYNTVKTGLQDKWKEVKQWWKNADFSEWITQHVKPNFATEKWLQIYEPIKSSIKTKWENMTTWWNNSAMGKWFENDVKPWFSEKNWTWDGIKEGLGSSFNNAIEGIKSIWNGFAEWINSILKFEIPEVDLPIVGKVGGFTIDLGHLPTFADGGFPEDGLFMANHGELVGQFSDGRTAVANNDQIIAGIEEAAYRGFSRAYAENSQEENLLRELIQAVKEGKNISIDGREIVSAYDSRKARNGYAF